MAPCKSPDSMNKTSTLGGWVRVTVRRRMERWSRISYSTALTETDRRQIEAPTTTHRTKGKGCVKLLTVLYASVARHYCIAEWAFSCGQGRRCPRMGWARSRWCGCIRCRTWRPWRWQGLGRPGRPRCMTVYVCRDRLVGVSVLIVVHICGQL